MAAQMEDVARHHYGLEGDQITARLVCGLEVAGADFSIGDQRSTSGNVVARVSVSTADRQ